MMIGANDDWCVLRTSSMQTLNLTALLTAEGLRAWTPTEVQQQRARRSMPRREIIVALMPSVVFAGYDHLVDLIRISRSAMPHVVWDAQLRRHVAKGWPHFRVMRDSDRYARIGDRELSGLRRAESVGLTLAKRKTFRPGLNVRLMDGPGEGLRGTIEAIKDTFATVRFPGWALTMTVAFHLLEAEAE